MKQLQTIQQKIVQREDLPSRLDESFRATHRIVFTNGCFDILHLGHASYLADARDLGDVLVVGLNTDESVRRIKGKNRPVKDQHTRALLLASLQVVDLVVLFGEDTPAELIRLVKPDILAKGGDYRKEEIVGYETVTAYGGKIVTIPFVEGQSSSSLIQKIEKG